MTDSNEKPKMVCVVRRDLNMRKGKIASQVAHASMKVIFDRLVLLNEESFIFTPEEDLRSWMSGSFTKIVVHVNSEEELLAIYANAQNSGIICSLIQDNGDTEFKGVKTYTTVAVGPGKPSIIDGITGHLPLL